jgi:bifunctional DNA-binding transcriptional regulator/antitoxin component of YhaV-PrlF toxin-antitoxin module
MPQLLEVTHVSERGTLLRITLPKRVAEILGIGKREMLGFYEVGGKIVIRKMK